MSNPVKSFIVKLESNPARISFADTMAVIDNYYTYTPSAFTNGSQQNAVDQNVGSCKILAFAQINELTSEQALHCFGDYYRKDVLENPEGSDHGNIRALMSTGLEAVEFEEFPLSLKEG